MACLVELKPLKAKKKAHYFQCEFILYSSCGDQNEDCDKWGGYFLISLLHIWSLWKSSFPLSLLFALGERLIIGASLESEWIIQALLWVEYRGALSIFSMHLPPHLLPIISKTVAVTKEHSLVCPSSMEFTCLLAWDIVCVSAFPMYKKCSNIKRVVSHAASIYFWPRKSWDPFSGCLFTGPTATSHSNSSIISTLGPTEESPETMPGTDHDVTTEKNTAKSTSAAGAVVTDSRVSTMDKSTTTTLTPEAVSTLSTHSTAPVETEQAANHVQEKTPVSDVDGYDEGTYLVFLTSLLGDSWDRAGKDLYIHWGSQKQKCVDIILFQGNFDLESSKQVCRFAILVLGSPFAFHHLIIIFCLFMQTSLVCQQPAH